MRDVLQSDVLFDAVPAINEAFHEARQVAQKAANGTSASGGVGEDYIERSEFRVFLEKLRQNFEYLQAYNR